MSSSPRLSPEAWRKVNDVFHHAIDLPGDERAAFIDKACEGDPTARAEVLSLVAAHERADEFIEGTASTPADLRDLGLEESERLVGQTVGQYRISRVLGVGGMGVVYLAEDLRLGRAVALKALAPRFTGDESRRERLRREARAAAGLSHPGIATVYALEEFDGNMFIAGEYVPGETLRDELSRGPLGVARTIDTALAIARALAAAHDRGIVHRDLKPENVIRTPGGDLKILDFGLARMRDAGPDTARLTDDGTFLGTPAYMSPEQIRGEPVDARSDLFSLGTVLHELVTGAHPFAAADPASTIARILEREPAPIASLVNAEAGDLTMLGALESVVRTCLRKSPAARYASTHDLVTALELAREGRSTTPSVAGRIRSGSLAPPAPALWWWQFHEIAACTGYLLLLVPLWLAREWMASELGRALFLVGLVAGTAAAILRLHLWFTVRSYPSEWPRQRAQSGVWIRIADIVFAIVVFAAGLAVRDEHASAAALLLGSAVAVFLSFAIIEPATTHAAFGDAPDR